MRKTVLALSISLVLAAGTTVITANPQDEQNQNQEHGRRRGGRGPMTMDPQHHADMLAKQLKLSDDQKAKLTPIFTDEQQQMQSLRQDTSMSREDRMAKMKSIHEDTNTKVNGILTDEQKQKYADMQQKMRDRMQQRMHDHAEQNGGSNPNQ